MKFLDPRFEGMNLMPIHVMSYDSFELGARDALAFIFKDMHTGKKYVETIDKPKYEVWVLKREYWKDVHYMDVYEDMAKLDKYTISYHYRDKELAKILGCEPNDVKYSPYLFGYDISIEHFYWMNFILEYGNDLPKKISVGFLDIESDIIQTQGKFAAPGEAPTSAVTFIDADHKHVYTIVVGKDNLPVVAETHPKYRSLQDIKDKFYAQLDDIKKNIPGFISELHELFDESYGELEYDFIMVDEEIKLHQILWEILRRAGIDYLLIWNAPYDARNLIERPLVLGYEPESIICDKDFKYPTCFFEEDDNIQAHKRNHRCIIGVKFLILCQMWMYAGIRSTQGRQSLKLTVVAKKEIKDEKLNYEEEGNIAIFLYKNARKYFIYNIKDVLLQLGIYRVSKDIDTIYDRAYENAILLPEAFVSTTMLTQSMTLFFRKEGFIMGTNANRILAPFDYHKFIAENTAGAREIEELQEAAEINPDDWFDDSMEDEDGDPYDEDDFY